MIRLHCLINTLAPQGAQNVLYRLLSRIDRSRFDPTVTTLIDHAPMADQFEAIGVRVQSLGLHGSMSLPLAVCRLACRLRREPPDIVQTWLYHSDLIGGLAARLAGTARIVWNIRHSNLDPEVNRRSTLLVARCCAHLSGWMPARIVCCAEAARQSHVQYGYAAGKFEVIPNGFDIDVLTRQPQARRSVCDELGLPESSLVIGMLARFHPQKDHRNFIEAAGRFAAARPHCAFLLAGDDVSWDNRELAGWIRQAAIADKVRLLGRRNDVPRLLSALALAASSSLVEGFPNAVGEAMACEVPCAVTDVGDTALLVGDAGLVVPPGDPAALAGAWGSIAAMNPEQRQLLGRKGRQRIREKFSIDAVAACYESLYAELARSGQECPAPARMTETS